MADCRRFKNKYIKNNVIAQIDNTPPHRLTLIQKLFTIISHSKNIIIFHANRRDSKITPTLRYILTHDSVGDTFKLLNSVTKRMQSERE